MDYKIVLSRGAEEDLDGFVAYLLFEKKSEQAARNLLNDFEATKTSLSKSQTKRVRILQNQFPIASIFYVVSY